MVSISIVIPVYHVEPYIQRCLESVMAQDKAEANIECILVDDCGQDCSMAIARATVANYQGSITFRIVSHKENRGLSAARNTGLSQATGDYVMFIDSDDYLLPDSISYFLENLERHPDVDIVMGNVRNCKDGGLMIRNISEPWLIDQPDIFFRRVLHHQIYLYAWNKLIRRDVLTRNGILFEEGTIYEDQLWSYLVFSCVSTVLLLPNITYIYENNPNSIVNTTFTAEKAERAVWSYTVSCNKMLDRPPVPQRYTRNMTVDYLLFMSYFLMNGADVASRSVISQEVRRDFLAVRKRLMFLSLRYGRFVLACFFLLLFSPFNRIQKWRLFRHHYYDLESVVNEVAHLTDFLHRKDRL